MRQRQSRTSTYFRINKNVDFIILFQDLRRRHSSSPSLGSTGSGNESLPRSSTSGANDLVCCDFNLNCLQNYTECRSTKLKRLFSNHF